MMLNISKNRTFFENMYFVYHLSRKKLGEYLNLWFKDSNIKRDCYWTVKKVDNVTMNRLYGYRYNPISINIMFYNKEYVMKAQIHSIDDSSFGIWFDGNYETLSKIRHSLMKYISEVSIINGEDFIQKCISIGANKDSIDYN